MVRFFAIAIFISLSCSQGFEPSQVPTSSLKGNPNYSVAQGSAACRTANILLQAGWSRSALATGVCIANHESGFAESAHGDFFHARRGQDQYRSRSACVGSNYCGSVGLFQILHLHWDKPACNCGPDGSRCKEGLQNAKCAWAISSQGSNFNPWSTYNPQWGYQYLCSKPEYVKPLSACNLNASPSQSVSGEAPAPEGQTAGRSGEQTGEEGNNSADATGGEPGNTDLVNRACDALGQYSEINTCGKSFRSFRFPSNSLVNCQERKLETCSQGCYAAQLGQHDFCLDSPGDTTDTSTETARQACDSLGQYSDVSTCGKSFRYFDLPENSLVDCKEIKIKTCQKGCSVAALGQDDSCID